MTLPCRPTAAPQPVALVVAVLVVVAALAVVTPSAQSPAPPEVRQIVTFRFVPGRATEAVAIYERRLKPVYEDTAPLLRFRAYREAESPEPLDLVVVSSYQGMAGMDAANDALRARHRSGVAAFEVYGELSGMTTAHHDQFVEMLPRRGDPPADGLTVFEYLKLTPGSGRAFERLLAETIEPFERERRLYQGSESGRLIVADGWDYLRMHGIRSLADWHAAVTAARGAAFQSSLDPLVAARKVIILRVDARLSVR